MSNRIKGIWKDVDNSFFETSIPLPPPDEIIDAVEFDVAHRELAETPHPLQGRMSEGGCYLYYCYYDWGEGTKPVYIYAGKSKKFSKRLWTHGRDKERIEQFFKLYWDTGALGWSVLLKSGSTALIHPHPIVRIALWFVKDKREMLMLEHGLIYAYRPYMNVG